MSLSAWTVFCENINEVLIEQKLVGSSANDEKTTQLEVLLKIERELLL